MENDGKGFLPKRVLIRWVAMSIFLVAVMMYGALDVGMSREGLSFILVLALFCCFAAGTVLVIFRIAFGAEEIA
jgi:hypothetical protein